MQYSTQILVLGCLTVGWVIGLTFWWLRMFFRLCALEGSFRALLSLVQAHQKALHSTLSQQQAKKIPVLVYGLTETEQAERDEIAFRKRYRYLEPT